MKSFRKNRKALSPVIASIILIAVTVAVSIAVAAWMGALVVGQMNTEQLKITSMACNVDTDTITVDVRNLGTNGVIIDGVWVNDASASFDCTPSATIGANGEATITVTDVGDLISGGNYQVKIQTATGYQFFFNAVA